MKHISIQVENIKCGGCENTIRKEILHQPGVQAVHIDGEHQIIHITGDDDMDKGHIAARLEHLGYPEAGRNSVVSKIKSYVSCATGRLTDQVGESNA
jgi:copper chaperone CopZ